MLYFAQQSLREYNPAGLVQCCCLLPVLCHKRHISHVRRTYECNYNTQFIDQGNISHTLWMRHTSAGNSHTHKQKTSSKRGKSDPYLHYTYDTRFCTNSTPKYSLHHFYGGFSMYKKLLTNLGFACERQSLVVIPSARVSTHIPAGNQIGWLYVLTERK